MSIEFLENAGTFTGAGRGGRLWRISRTLTGWRLEFVDPGDSRHTNAGVFPSVKLAKAAANH